MRRRTSLIEVTYQAGYIQRIHDSASVGVAARMDNKSPVDIEQKIGVGMRA
jgi:hypothetical protein